MRRKQRSTSLAVKQKNHRSSRWFFSNSIEQQKLFCLVSHHSKAFLPLVRCNLMLFSFSSARHRRTPLSLDAERAALDAITRLLCRFGNVWSSRKTEPGKNASTGRNLIPQLGDTDIRPVDRVVDKTRCRHARLSVQALQQQRGRSDSRTVGIGILRFLPESHTNKNPFLYGSCTCSSREALGMMGLGEKR